MAEHFDTFLDEERPVSECRALVPYSRYPRAYDVAAATPADAVFLASLIAHVGHHETARKRRAARPAEAISCYRAGGLLADEPGSSSVRIL
ncbi:MAG: hypothetical protein BGP06_11075 [Rhizobiales bacterium 65-9]|mgnify:CR=1 FL=1|nr:hypothetical protein [Hyphomicrobiales bacterium]OJY32871.1 MAG: hypothetical protein BGP06_11075 [Rhizobiales bacterium 65-9]